MTFLNKLKAHVGGLISIKTELYLYATGLAITDEDPGRICLLLDIQPEPPELELYDGQSAGPADPGTSKSAAALLFIDGMSKWILIWADDVELIE